MHGYLNVLFYKILEKEEDTSPGLCRDKLPNCEMYGEQACQDLPIWAANNCERTCKVCIPGKFVFSESIFL